jgi:uncharacterized protein YbaA (DUF1428 family)
MFMNMVEDNRNIDGSIVEIFLYRAPKKNHDSLVRLNKQSHDFFMKYGALKFEVFTINNRENMMDFVNLSKTISANEDEEVWLEIQSYKNSQHVKEFIDKMKDDKSMETLYNEFMNLITPDSVVSFGGFDKIEEVS